MKMKNALWVILIASLMMFLMNDAVLPGWSYSTGGEDGPQAVSVLIVDKGADISPVPAKTLLLGIGLAGIAGGVARRKLKKKTLKTKSIEEREECLRWSP